MNKIKYIILSLIALNATCVLYAENSSDIKYISITSKEEVGNFDNKGAKGDNSIAIGPNVSVERNNSIGIGKGVSVLQSEAIAIGNEANTKSKGTVTLGDKASTVGTSAIAIGSESSTWLGNYTIAIGSKSRAQGDNSISIGKESKTTIDGAMAIGNSTIASGGYSIAQGNKAIATGTASISLGMNAINDDSTGGIAIGGLSVIKYINSDEISIVEKTIKNNDGKAEVETPRLPEEDIRKDYGDTYGAISIGLQSSSHDAGAISMGLFSTALKFGSLALGHDTSALNTGAIAIGRGTASYGVDSLAVGRKSVVDSDNGVAIGKQTGVFAENSAAFGSFSIVKEDDVKDGLAVYSNEEIKAENGVISVGNEDNHRRIINVAGGIDDYDAVNVLQLKKAIEDATSNNVDIYDNKTDEDGNILDKDGDKLVKDEIDGKYYKDNGNGEPDKTKDPSKPVKVLKGIQFVGNLNNGEYKKTLGEEIKILGNNDKNVIVSDFSTTNVITENTAEGINIKMSDKPVFKEICVKNDTGKTATIKVDNDGNVVINDEKLVTNSNFSKIEKNTINALSGVASSMAMANIPQVIDKNRPYTIGAATALYQGEGALAVGVSGVNKTGNLIFKASTAINTKLGLGAGVGISYAFGEVYNNLTEITSNKNEMLDYITQMENDINKYKELANTANENANKANKKVEELEKKVEMLLKNKDSNIVENTKLQDERILKLLNDKVYIVPNFNTDDYIISENDKEDLKKLVELLNDKVDSGVIDIVGHADIRGKFNYNLELGLKRAKAVVDLLKNYGLNSNIRFRNITSGGIIAPISDVNSENRRVEIYFDSLKLK